MISIRSWIQRGHLELNRKTRWKLSEKRKISGMEELEWIGVAGSGASVGVTHFALMTAAYLSGVMRLRTAVLEQNRSGAFAQLEKICQAKKRGENLVMGQEEKPFKIMEVFFYKEAGTEERYECLKQGVEVAVMDFGVLTENNRDAFFHCSRRFLVGSASGWQLAEFANLVAEKQKWPAGCEFFITFGEEETVEMTERYLNIRVRRIPLQRDALIVTGETMTFFGKFLQ